MLSYPFVMYSRPCIYNSTQEQYHHEMEAQLAGNQTAF